MTRLDTPVTRRASVARLLGVAIFVALLWWPLAVSEALYPFELRVLWRSVVLQRLWWAATVSWVVIVGVITAASLATTWLIADWPAERRDPAVWVACFISAVLMVTRLGDGLQAELAILYALGSSAAIAWLVGRNPEGRGRVLDLLGMASWAVFAISLVRTRSIVDEPHALLLAVALVPSALLVAFPGSPLRRGLRDLALVAALVTSVAMVAPGRRTPPPPPVVAAPAPATMPNVVVFMVDTLRADHLSAFGYGLPTSPHLDALAHTTRFTQAWAGSSSTPPSVRTLFTGQRAFTHGCADESQTPARDDDWTMPKAFQAAGYRTALIGANGIIDKPGNIAGFDDVWMINGLFSQRPSTLLRGFRFGSDGFWDIARRYREWRSFKEKGVNVVQVAADELLAGDADQPFFAFVHLFDPHWPTRDRGMGMIPPALRDYVQPHTFVDFIEDKHLDPGSAEELAEMLGRYDDEIRFADEAFGDFVARLDAARVLDDTMIVFVGDHGEEYFEHGGFSHGHDVYVEEVHVPLVIHWPASLRTDALPPIVDTPVSLIDVYPTLRELLALPPGPDSSRREGLEGTSLASIVDGVVPEHVVVTETFLPRCRAMYRVGDTTVRITTSRSHGPLDTEEVVAFDLTADPAQQRPLDDLSHEIDRYVRHDLHKLWSTWDRSREPLDDAEEGDDPELELLKKLGYVH